MTLKKGSSECKICVLRSILTRLCEVVKLLKEEDYSKQTKEQNILQLNSVETSIASVKSLQLRKADGENSRAASLVNPCCYALPKRTNE